MSYLELQANKYAKKYTSEFEKKIKMFKKCVKYSESECVKIYDNYLPI